MKIIENGTVTSPIGFFGAGAHVGIKKEKKDLALIYSQVDAKAVGTFTQNIVKAAPVLWDKMIVENSGLLTVAALKHLKCKNKRVVSILSGGNMDIITLSSVVQHGLIRRGRVFTIAVLLPDRPGELVRVANVIAEMNGNIIRLEHNQFVSINRNSAVELTITLEAFGHEHKQQIINALREKGYNPKLENPTGIY